MRLEGKRALIVGADPVAAGIATRYRAEGAAVTVVSPAEALDKAALSEMAGERLDILVLGGEDVPPEPEWAPVSAITPERLDAASHRLILPALAAVQACEAALKAAAHASAIFVHAPWGWYSDGGWGEQTLAYHTRHGLMRAIGSEWGPVRANMLVPHADTPGLALFRQRNPAEVDARIRMSAMRRLGDPVTDIGGAAVFLGSDDTRFVNGMVVYADGGAHMTAPAIETKMPPAP